MVCSLTSHSNHAGYIVPHIHKLLTIANDRIRDGKPNISVVLKSEISDKENLRFTNRKSYFHVIRLKYVILVVL
jgi:hypothetical protein